MENRHLFYGGVIGPLFFLLVELVGGAMTPNYSIVTDTVSAMTAAGSPNALLLSSFYLASAILGFAFGIGLLRDSMPRRSRLLRMGSMFLIVIAVLNSLTGTVFPTDPVGAGMTAAGLLHVVLVAVGAIMVMLLVPFVGIGMNRTRKPGTRTRLSRN